MKRKHVSLLALAILFSSNAWSQMTIIPRAGFNYSTISEKDNDDSYNEDKKYLVGYHVGALVNYELTDALSFRTGLLVTGRGMKYDSESTDSYDILGTTYTTTISYKSTTSLTYLEVPVGINIGLEAGDSKLNIGFGPYVAFGLAGTTKWESKTTQSAGATTSTSENSGSDKIEWGNDQNEDDLKPLDFGLFPTLGMDFGKLEVELSYRMGLSNISLYDENGYRANNKTFMLTLGYIIGE